MYSNEVNDLLQVNLANIKRLFELIAKSTGWKKKHNLEDVFVTKIPTLDQVLHCLRGRIDDVNE